MTDQTPSTLRDPAALLAAGLIPPGRLGELERVAARYAVSLTPDIAALIDPSDPHDPIARQFVPDRGRARDSRRRDARTRSATTRTRRSRASCTAIPTACCSSSCMSVRSIAGSASAARWSGRAAGSRCRAPRSTRALDYIRAHPEIWEVILTGGDPLILSPRRLREVVRALGAIEHVKIIRVHTRVPVVAPDRISAALVRALKVPRQGHLCGAARQPSARADRARARRLRAHRRCRHSDAEPERAAARRQRRRGRRSAR